MRIVIAACLLAVAALAAPPQDPAPAPGPKTQFVFRWPVPSTAVVTETTQKAGRSATTRYRLEFVQGSKPDERLVRLRDFEFVKLQGLDLDDPKVQRQLAPQLALAQAIPDLAIASDGTFRTVTDVDSMIERFLDYDKKLPDRDPRRGEALAASLREPRVKELMSQSGAAFWNCWAGHWAGRELQPGVPTTASASSLLSGAAVPGNATLRHHGPGAVAGSVKLSMELKASGADVARSMLEALSPDLARRDTGLKDLKVTLSAEVVLDPATLRPHTASYERMVEVTPPGEPKPVQQVERHGYEFVWK